MMNVSNHRMLVLATYAFYVIAYIEDLLPFGQVFVFASLALMLYAHINIHRYELVSRLSYYYVYMLAFMVYCLCSLIWAEDRSLTMVIVRGHFFNLIIMSIVFWCNSGDTKVEDLLKIIMNGGYIVVMFIILRYGRSGIASTLANEERFSNEAMNANTLGMCAAYSVVINVYFIYYFRKLHWRDLLIIPAAYAIASSASRKALVILGVGILMVVIMKNLGSKDFGKKMLKLFAGLAAIVALLFYLSTLPMFSLLKDRMDALIRVMTGVSGKGTSGYLRTVYVRIGLQLFQEHPITGIGLHNASRYIVQYAGHPHLHNNFVELLACGGIIGFGIYYSVYFYQAWKFLKFRNRRDGEYDICLILFALRFVMGYGHIQYRSAVTYFFLMLFCVEIYRLQDKGETIEELSELLDEGDIELT